MRDAVEPREVEANAMRPPQETHQSEDQEQTTESRGSELTVASSTTNETFKPFTWKPNVGGKNIPNLEKLCRNAYENDKTFRKIIKHPKDHKSFEVTDGIIYRKIDAEHKVTCIPESNVRGRRLTELVIDQAHRIVGHLGARITESYARRFFWWTTLGPDIKAFCDSCSTCQATKTSNQRPQGLLHALPIPSTPWSSIGMDFVGPFPMVDNLDYIWVVLCRLTSLVHLIPLRTTNTAAELAPIFMAEIVRLHGLPDTIVSDRDPKFTSQFWTETHRLLGIKLAKSTAFHPQSNGVSERMIRKVSQILRTVVRPDQLDWPKHLPMVEFSINSSVVASTGYAPFELTYGYVPKMIKMIERTEYAGVQDFADKARDMVLNAHDALIRARIDQTYHANQKRRSDDKRLITGNKAYLSMENLNLPKARARKLMPKYIGPYKILSCNRENSHYTLELPEELLKRRIHPTFHARLLRPAIKNDDVHFPNREATFFYDFGDDPDKEWNVNLIVDHKHIGNTIFFDVQWETGETTREPYINCKELEALDRYLELHGVKHWRELQKKAKAPNKKM